MESSLEAVEAVFDKLADGGDDEPSKPELAIEAEAEEAATEPQEAGESELAESSQEIEPLEPPKYWKKEAKEHFRKAPREIQEYLVERDRDMNSYFTKKSQEISGSQKEYESVFEPYKDELAQLQSTPKQAIENLLSWHKILKEYGPRALPALMQAYGYEDPSQHQGNMQSASQPDLAFRQLQAELHEIKAKLEGETESQRIAAVSDEIRQFASEQGPDGQLLRPHFGTLAPVIKANLAEINQLPEAQTLSNKEKLELAHDMAMEMASGVSTPREQARAKQEVEKAQKAKVAAGSVKGSGGVSQAPKPRNSVDAVTRIYNKLAD